MNLTYKQRDNIWLNTVKKKQLLFYIHFFKIQDSDKIKEKNPTNMVARITMIKNPKSG